MTGKRLYRSLRRRCDVFIVWAMVPVALLSGRTVSGCMSPTGRFEPDCHCAAMQEADGSSSTTCEASPCHCACCHGKCCCCGKGNAGCCKTVANKSNQQNSDGLHDGGHCRPFSLFVGVTVTNANGQTSDFHQAAEMLPLAIAGSLPNPFVVSSKTVELDTGPPPNNLVVALHRWLI
jgi:hypothetical protein